MPAAAVIPAPIAYIKVVAVKKLVVGFRGLASRPAAQVAAAVRACVGSVRREACTVRRPLCSRRLRLLFVAAVGGFGTFTLNKLECSKQAVRFEYVSME